MARGFELSRRSRRMMMSTEEREERRRGGCGDCKKVKERSMSICGGSSAEARSSESQLSSKGDEGEREGRKDAPVSLTKAPSTTNSPLLLPLLSLLSLPTSPPPLAVVETSLRAPLE